MRHGLGDTHLPPRFLGQNMSDKKSVPSMLTIPGPARFFPANFPIHPADLPVCEWDELCHALATGPGEEGEPHVREREL